MTKVILFKNRQKNVLNEESNNISEISKQIATLQNAQLQIEKRFQNQIQNLEKQKQTQLQRIQQQIIQLQSQMGAAGANIQQGLQQNPQQNSQSQTTGVDAVKK